jgi:formylglycine-generating enzyme required for sulfatase activity
MSSNDNNNNDNDDDDLEGLMGENSESKTGGKLAFEEKVLDVAGIPVETVVVPSLGLEATKFAVTNQVYEALTGKAAPSEVRLTDIEELGAIGETPDGTQLRDFPVTNVSWFDAVILANMMSKEQGLEPCYVLEYEEDGVTLAAVEILEGKNGWRLPTVEEWKSLAAGGEDFDYPGSNDPDEVAWHSGNSGSRIHRVGQLKPNGINLFDTAGNAWEWTGTVKS